jgi:hypothetical protein
MREKEEAYLVRICRRRHHICHGRHREEVAGERERGREAGRCLLI